MPKLDSLHHAVRNALIKDGWEITHDPFTIEYMGTRVYADLGAEKPLAACKGNNQIVVEIKVFSSPSLITELQKTLGQYGVYRSFLRRVDPKRMLYLAIPIAIYNDFFQRPATQIIVEDHALKLLVFDPNSEEIVQWIE